MSSSEFLKRPTVEEDDEDLQKMQQEWENSKKKTSVEVHRMKKRPKPEEKERKVPSLPKSTRDQAARFQIDLDDIREECTVSDVLFGVQERNADFLKEDKTDEMLKISLISKYSKDDGFPETLDLSAYYSKNAEISRKSTGKSFFAAEFDRIHGDLAENLDLQVDAENVQEEDTSGDFQTENEKYLKNLDADKILELRKEIEERLNPQMIEFLTKRGQKDAKMDKNEKKPEKISKFKARKLEKVEKPVEKPVQKQEVEVLNELEVLEEWKDREDQEKYNRLATDAIQLDLTAKFGRNLVNRQQKNAVKLFDNCKMRPESEKPSDALLELARSCLEQIKLLYLEEISQDGQLSYQFGAGLSPILDNCWTLIPVRRVLDAVEKRQGKVLPDDLEIVRLSLLWTLLLFEERKSAFFAFAQPDDFYVHLAEVFMIGAEVLSDDVIVECTARILNGYIMPAARDSKICLRMASKVAGLDAFMPFFEQLIRCYEQYSMGDASFAKAILIGAYLNVPVGDSIEYRMSLWSPKRNTIRQLTVTSSSCRDLLAAIKKQIEERENVIFEQHYVQYCSLLGVYVTAIRDEVVTRDRNQLMFEIAAFEIGKFMEKQKREEGRKKEFQVLVDIIQKSIGDKTAVRNSCCSSVWLETASDSTKSAIESITTLRLPKKLHISLANCRYGDAGILLELGSHTTHRTPQVVRLQIAADVVILHVIGVISQIGVSDRIIQMVIGSKNSQARAGSFSKPIHKFHGFRMTHRLALLQIGATNDLSSSSTSRNYKISFLR